MLREQIRPRVNFLFLIGALLVSACDDPLPESATPVFQHGQVEGAAPWSHSRFDDAPDKFTFAIISDLNGGERDGVFEVAAAQLALLRPEFVINLGDAIDGGKEDRGQLTAEWESFDARASNVPGPLFHIGGNHDLTNLAMREVWEERYGPLHYYFVYKNVLFLALNSEDLAPERLQEVYIARKETLRLLASDTPEEAQNSEYMSMPERLTGEISDAQSAYFESVIQSHPDVRWTFVLMHKPVWQREGAGGMARIEAALEGRPYTVFNAHLHNYSHRMRFGQDYVMLGTTGGSQNPNNDKAFDHVTLVTLTDDDPVIGNLRLDGILDKTAEIPLEGGKLCFEAPSCAERN